MTLHSHTPKNQDSSTKHVSRAAHFKMLDVILKRHQYRQDALIEILHQVQDLFGYLETDLLRYIAQCLRLPLSRVYGVATFYHLFSLAPRGTHRCVVCTGTACYVKGAAALLTTVEQFAHIHAGETTPDHCLSVSTTRCPGTCGLAPIVVFDDQVCGYQTPNSVRDRLKPLLKQT
ncbi:MAG: bidirectional hydrogenase complex protein HoxE [Oscillatoriophycideae cyanobacterium NC_groundwater_1537_Pr4_S-0.65um_50_18]|nr:bidirectional hydrogenase complex protein HoxE [Oscillatoriophycideae cyanobacterium NC_groundwater_1537_Pr4_S-0.65um_50_18]